MTMAVRIERIKINRQGPLNEDFVLEPGDVNLVYGPNETGKTFIVETLISLLFRTGRKAAVQWGLRGWDVGGSVSVSGLDERNVSFTKTSKKLEDYWEGGTGLPQDFSRLLVVKAGETLLDSKNPDGVGRDILKNYLSGEGLLDEIENEIPANIRKAEVSAGDIAGVQQGEVRSRRELVSELKRLDDLLDRAGSAYASSEMDRLKKRHEEITSQLEILGRAKKYRAAHVYKEKGTLQQKIGKMPDEQQLLSLAENVATCEKSRATLAAEQHKLQEIKDASDDYRWAEKALELYKELSARAVPHQGWLYVVLTCVGLAAAGTTGYLGFTIPMLTSIGFLLLVAVAYFVTMRRVLAASGESSELERLKGEYRARFQEELSNRAVLEARLETLRADYYRYENFKNNLDDLTSRLQEEERNLRIEIRTATGKDLAPDEWRPAVAKMRDERANLAKKIESLKTELAVLAVRDMEVNGADPGIEWDESTYAYLWREREGIERSQKEKETELEGLRMGIVRETDSASRDWEELLYALKQKRESVLEDYKQITARILAGKKVCEVIKEYRDQENARIATGLGASELTSPLHQVTLRYKSVRHDEERGLVLTSDEESEYNLSELSTGAREQVFLALRMGFAAIAMKGQPAFLILDDAFQHSDWPRRENLVDQVVRLEKSGWQIFYFTMDDHIRDLFLKAGEKLGKSFWYTVLER